MKIKSIITLHFMIISLASCQSTVIKKDTEQVSIDVFAMDTYMNLKAYTCDGEQVLKEAEERIHELENELSTTLEISDVWKINHSDEKEISVSDDTALLIEKAIEIGHTTNGVLDISIYPILKEWGFTTEEYHVPEKNKLDDLLKNVDYSKISLKDKNVSIPKDSEIDLGALAKGYTGDEIMNIFKSHGVESAIINLGGNVQTLGNKPDGSDWKVAVRNPFNPETDMCIVEIHDKAVITSGNYERFFTDYDGTKYWHIIDPSDGYPADNGFVSVTVIGENGLTCDCLSTALFVAGVEEYTGIIREFPGYDFIFVTDDEKIYYTNGIEETFQNISSMNAEVINID